MVERTVTGQQLTLHCQDVTGKIRGFLSERESVLEVAKGSPEGREVREKSNPHTWDDRPGRWANPWV